MLDKLDTTFLVDADHKNYKVKGSSNKWLFSVVRPTRMNWFSKIQKPEKTSTFGDEFTASKRDVDDSVMLRYYLRPMEVKVTRTSPIFVDNMIIILNAKNSCS